MAAVSASAAGYYHQENVAHGGCVIISDRDLRRTTVCVRVDAVVSIHHQQAPRRTIAGSLIVRI